MLANSLLSVKLGQDSLNRKLPQEIGSIVYVACTRVTKLEHLFVSPILNAVGCQQLKSITNICKTKPIALNVQLYCEILTDTSAPAAAQKMSVAGERCLSQETS